MKILTFKMNGPYLNLGRALRFPRVFPVYRTRSPFKIPFAAQVDLSSILASDELDASSEEAVFEQLQRWMIADAPANRAGPPSAAPLRGLTLLRHVRFPLMDGAARA